MTDDDEGADILPFPAPTNGQDDWLAELGADDEEFLREWDEAERSVVALLREALADRIGQEPPAELAGAAERLRAGVSDRGWPYRHIAAAAEWRSEAPADDRRCCIQAAGALAAMGGESGMGIEVDSLIMALQHADWVGAVVGLVRAGPGAAAEEADLVRYINECPELEGDISVEDEQLIASAFDTVLHIWEAAGVVTQDRVLTSLGAWVLPRALAWAWNGDFDGGDTNRAE